MKTKEEIHDIVEEWDDIEREDARDDEDVDALFKKYFGKA
jgi:hypothetical protein